MQVKVHFFPTFRIFYAYFPTSRHHLTHKMQQKVSFQQDSITQKQFSKQKISVTLRNKTSRLSYY